MRPHLAQNGVSLCPSKGPVMRESTFPPPTFTQQELWEHARVAACRVALEAWTAIRHLYAGGYAVVEKDDGPATDADRIADRFIIERLGQQFPPEKYGYLTEESEEDPSRRDRKRVWIIDPIDGTKDFIARNGNFAVHIALVERLEDGRWHPVAAVVYQPIPGLLYSAVRGRGARRQRIKSPSRAVLALDAPGRVGDGIVETVAPLRVSERSAMGELRALVSNANPASRLTRLMENMPIESYQHLGSLGVKVCMMAQGDAEFYMIIGLGRAKEWDACAPHLILGEAGGRMTDLHGRELEYNLEDVRLMQGMLASNGHCHDAVLAHARAWLDDAVNR